MSELAAHHIMVLEAAADRQYGGTYTPAQALELAGAITWALPYVKAVAECTTGRFSYLSDRLQDQSHSNYINECDRQDLREAAALLVGCSEIVTNDRLVKALKQAVKPQKLTNAIVWVHDDVVYDAPLGAACTLGRVVRTVRVVRVASCSGPIKDSFIVEQRGTDAVGNERWARADADVETHTLRECMIELHNRLLKADES